MPKIGITGHTRLTSRTRTLVYAALRERLAAYPAAALHGITCLAAGADQLFARAVLDAGGTYEVILPARDYRDRVIRKSRLAAFDDLTTRATTVSYMPFDRSGREAYMAASQELIRRSDLLYAVWDGSRSTRLGDTADVVTAARRQRLSVRILWPVNAIRA